MTSLHAALLGVVQGLTEFLPISSSAHLILARALFGWDASDLALAFDVACHVGTLLAVLVYFRRDVRSMLGSGPAALLGAHDDDARLARRVVVGTIPIGLVGLLFADIITESTRNSTVAAATLAAGAVIMFLAERVGTKQRTERTLTDGEALLLGVAQAAALVPGVSRSGAVLTVAMLLGVRRERAARFAFLLGIPAILAAAGKEGIELMGIGLPSGALSLFGVGMLSSAVVGYLTVKYFIRFLANHSLDCFVVYRLAVAAAIMVMVAWP